MYAKLRGRGDRVETVLAAAQWFEDNPAGLSIEGSAHDLQAAPGVSPAVADLAVRVCPGNGADRSRPGPRDPWCAESGIPVPRHNVERQNRYSDGRLAVARLIGGDDNSHEAHLGLIELADPSARRGQSEMR